MDEPDPEQPGSRRAAAVGHRARDLLGRDFTAPAPNRRWAADFTDAATWAGIACLAFAVDIYSRAIAGWSAAADKRAKLVTDAQPPRNCRISASPAAAVQSPFGHRFTAFADGWHEPGNGRFPGW